MTFFTHSLTYLLTHLLTHLPTPLTYLTLPYASRSGAYLTLPYLTLPYLTSPYLTFPYLPLPSLTEEWYGFKCLCARCQCDDPLQAPLHLPYISPISPLYLPYISPQLRRPAAGALHDDQPSPEAEP